MWKRQPPAGTKIDWTSFPGLRYVVPFNDSDGVVRAYGRSTGVGVGTLVGDAVWGNRAPQNKPQISDSSVLLELSLGSIAQVRFPHSVDQQPNTTAITVFTLFDFLTASGTVNDLGVIADTTVDNNDGWRIFKGGNGFADNDQFRWRLPLGGNCDFTTTWAAGDTISITGTYSTADNTQRLYKDGEFGVELTGQANALANSGDALWMGAFVNGGSYDPHHNMRMLMVFDTVLTPADIRSLDANPYQIFQPRSLYVPVAKYTPAITEEDLGPGTVEGTISFDTTLDKTLIHTLTAEAAATFLTNLTMLQTAVIDSADVPASISFGIDLDKIISNIADRPVSFSANIDLEELDSNTASRVKTALFNMSASQNQTNVKIANNIITFDTNLTLDTFNQLASLAEANFNTTLTLDILNQLTAVAETTFNTNLVLDILNTISIERAVNFDTNLVLNVLNQLIAQTNVAFDINLALDVLKQLTAKAETTFNTNLAAEILNTIAANVNITLGNILDFEGTADGQGEISASITFLANLNQIQTNTITASKAFNLVMNLAQEQNVTLDKVATLNLLIQASDEYQVGKSISDNIDFDIQLTELENNTLNKVLLMTFNTLLDKSLSTAGSTFGPIVNFATVLNAQFGTDSDIFGEITFLSNLDQSIQTQKITDATMGFSIDADIITEIHLTVEGIINLSTIMSDTEANELLAQAGITFGHIAGLASINGADYGADISFGTIQSLQVNGFLVEFEIITPGERVYKIFINDRTTIVDGGNRIIRVRRT